ncbi:hypothetical protein E2C01_049957 [Portunus trituberculatus]|uniref:Uncharacterized protein n=1 Tax=Portunus trituberculatus TaxID=210409 RepID=A0A5B7GFY7_PORTR|nr:hypothetical protein [Portunus trituberculatus]
MTDGCARYGPLERSKWRVAAGGAAVCRLPPMLLAEPAVASGLPPPHPPFLHGSVAGSGGVGAGDVGGGGGAACERRDSQAVVVVAAGPAVLYGAPLLHAWSHPQAWWSLKGAGVQPAGCRAAPCTGCGRTAGTSLERNSYFVAIKFGIHLRPGRGLQQLPLVPSNAPGRAAVDATHSVSFQPQLGVSGAASLPVSPARRGRRPVLSAVFREPRFYIFQPEDNHKTRTHWSSPSHMAPHGPAVFAFYRTAKIRIAVIRCPGEKCVSLGVAAPLAAPCATRARTHRQIGDNLRHHTCLRRGYSPSHPTTTSGSQSENSFSGRLPGGPRRGGCEDARERLY